MVTVIELKAQTNPRQNWHLLDMKDDGYPGMSVEKAYNELLKNKKPKQEVLVAFIDDGLLLNQEDLKGKIWTNKKEMAGNEKDDDHNGYVDDVHGWNFSGFGDDTYKYIREYVRLKGKYENADTDKLKNTTEYAYWLKIKEAHDYAWNTKEPILEFVDSLMTFQKYWEPILGTENINYEMLKDRTPDENADIKVKDFHRSFIDMLSQSDETSQKKEAFWVKW